MININCKHCNSFNFCNCPDMRKRFLFLKYKPECILARRNNRKSECEFRLECFKPHIPNVLPPKPLRYERRFLRMDKEMTETNVGKDTLILRNGLLRTSQKVINGRVELWVCIDGVSDSRDVERKLDKVCVSQVHYHVLVFDEAVLDYSVFSQCLFNIEKDFPSHVKTNIQFAGFALKRMKKVMERYEHASPLLVEKSQLAEQRAESLEQPFCPSCGGYINYCPACGSSLYLKKSVDVKQTTIDLNRVAETMESDRCKKFCDDDVTDKETKMSKDSET